MTRIKFQSHCNAKIFYLCYCEGDFEVRALDGVHMLLVQSDNRRAPLLPALA